MGESKLQQLRKSSGLSQEEAADRVGVSTQTISGWEWNRPTRNVKKLEFLLEEYGAGLEDKVQVLLEMFGDDEIKLAIQKNILKEESTMGKPKMLHHLDARLRKALENKADYYLQGKNHSNSILTEKNSFDYELKTIAFEINSICEPDFISIAPQLLEVCDSVSQKVWTKKADEDLKDEALYQLSVSRNALGIDKRWDSFAKNGK